MAHTLLHDLGVRPGGDITMTMDRYGHLFEQLGDAAAGALNATDAASNGKPENVVQLPRS